MCHNENKCRLIVDLMSRAVSIVSFAMLPFFFIFTVTKKKTLKIDEHTGQWKEVHS